MVNSRTVAALAGIVASLTISVVAWVVFDIPFLFLFVPFVPFLFRRGAREEPPVRRCPECGFATRNPEYTHCPRDGTPLSDQSSRQARSR